MRVQHEGMLSVTSILESIRAVIPSRIAATIGVNHSHGMRDPIREQNVELAQQLIFSAEEGNLDAIQSLLAVDGIDVNGRDAYGYTPLILAADRGHTEVVQALLDFEGVDVNAAYVYGDTALIRASIEGYTPIARALISSKVINVNAVGRDGDTALTCAARAGHTEIVQA